MSTIHIFPEVAENMGQIKRTMDMENIIKSLDELRKKADEQGMEEISVIINSAFEICYNTYYIMLRKGFTEY